MSKEHDDYHAAGELEQRDRASDPHGEIITDGDLRAFEKHLKQKLQQQIDKRQGEEL